MKVLIKKKILSDNTIELRDYEVDKLIALNKPVKIIIDNFLIPQHDEYMILTPAKLKKGKVNNTQHSIYNSDQTYLLIGYEWKGKKIEREIEVNINFDTRIKLSQMWKGIVKNKSL